MSAEIADMNVFIDELPIDEVCPLPLANKDHEFDNGTPINLEIYHMKRWIDLL